MSTAVSLAAGPGGAWLARRVGPRVTLHPTARLGDARALELDADDVDVCFAGPPDQLVVIVRGGAATQVLLFNPPDLEVAARAEIDGRAELAAVTGARVALVVGEHRTLVLVRCAPRALIVQPVDAGPLVELVVGLDDNKLLISQPKKLEVWDATTRRAAARLNLPLLPPPRVMGAAKASFWGARLGHPDLIVYRASDGRPFQHQMPGPIAHVASHLASPQVVVATDAGYARVHALAHALGTFAARPAAALVQGVTGDEPILYGCDADGTLWRMSLVEGAADAQPSAVKEAPARGASATASSSAAGASAGAAGAAGGATATPRRAAPARPSAVPAALGGDGPMAWRAELARWAGDAIARGAALDGEPAVPFDAALGELGDRVGRVAWRALAFLYGAWLRGAPGVALATAAAALGGGDDGWTEVLGGGELGARGWIDVRGGEALLVATVARHLDGAAPQAVRLRGEPPAREPVRGAFVARAEAAAPAGPAAAEAAGASDAGARPDALADAPAAVDAAPAALTLDALVSRLGGLAELLPGADVEVGALEARLRDVPLVIPPGAARARAIAAAAARGADLIAIVTPTAPLPAPLAALPPWR